MVVLTTVPYLAGCLASDATWQFEGFVISADDGRSYLAKMRQGADGYWLWHLTYTHEPHSGGPFYFFYLWLGKLCRVLHLPFITGFHVARVIGGLLLGWVLYRTLAIFVARPAQRRFAFWMALLGGGWGWLWLLLGGSTGLWKMPVDLWVPDGYVWYATLIAPHYAFSHAILLLALGRGARYVQTGAIGDQVQAAFWLLLSVLMHPYSVFIVVLLLGLWTLVWEWGKWQTVLRRGLGIAATVVPGVPYMLWVLWLFLKHPAFSAWAEQGINPSPPPWHYLVGYASFVQLALPILIRRQRSDAFAPMMTWTIAGGLILYVPLSAQRRFLEGWEFPWAVLAAEGLLVVYHRLRLPRGWRRALLNVLLLSSTLTTVTMLLGATLTAASRSPRIFLHRDEIAVYRWLETHASREDVVLASYTTSNRLPAYASVRVAWGVEPETIDSAQKSASIRRFYDGMPAEDQEALVCAWGVTYVIWGPQEQALGRFIPAAAAFLQPVETWGDWSLWTVKSDRCAGP